MDDQTTNNQAPVEGNADQLASEDVAAQQQEPAFQYGEDEPGDNRERSRLGRRVAKMEESLTKLIDIMSRRELQQTYEAPQQFRQDWTPPVPKDDEEVVYTKADVRRLLREEREREAKELEQREASYTNAYVNTIVQEAARQFPDDLSMRKAVVEELTQTGINRRGPDGKPLYTRHTGNPIQDALQNIRFARYELRSNTSTEARPAVRGSSNPPTGLSTTSRSAPPMRETVHIDEQSMKFLRGVNEDPNAEWVQESLRKGGFPGKR